MKHLKPLPISEEMLGAYIEGNLSAEESSMVKNIIDSDEMFQSFVSELSVPDSMIGGTFWDIFPAFDTEFELPSIPEIGYRQLGILSSEPVENVLIAPVVGADEDISLPPDGNTEIQTSINEANFEQTTFSMPEDNDLGGNDDFSSVLPEE